MIHAAVTIVALNYLPLARTLCRTCLQHPPQARFYVLLVDEPTPDFDPAAEPFGLVRLADIGLPDPDRFVYQYSIMELSTAVKPFVMQHLLARDALPNLLYLDPDLLIMRPLESIDRALQSSSIVLTPHMLSAPPDDRKTPAESDIMLSGAYNLGFLGVANDRNVDALLDWWKERLATKCIVDLANALFVDQRWMDMAPSYFEGVCILRDRTLNVAYWNLHERTLAYRDGAYWVDGQPLGFFHFSGFDPRKPEKLSKHQSRHRPGDNAALSRIVLLYAGLLIDEGYLEWSEKPVHFSRLANGVKTNFHTQWVIRQALDRHVPMPSPKDDPDAFCRFMATPNPEFDARGIAPVLASLEKRRPDVKAAFVPAFETPTQAEMIRSWFQGSGAKEEDLELFFERYGDLLDRADVCQRALSTWRARPDLRRAFPQAFGSLAGAEAYAEWIERHGTAESGFTSGEGKVFLSRRQGMVRPVMLFLQDVNLQKEFRLPFFERDRTRYVSWLYREAVPRRIVHHEDVAWFDGFAECAPDVLAAIVLGHGAWLHAEMVGGGTVFDLRNLTDLMSEYGRQADSAWLVRLYGSRLGASLLAQAEQHYYFNEKLRARHPRAFEPGGDVAGLKASVLALLNDIAPAGSARGSAPAARERGLQGLVRGLRDAVVKPAASSVAPAGAAAVTDQWAQAGQTVAAGFDAVAHGSPGVNLGGYFAASTGMGESVRSMARTLQAAGLPVAQLPLFSTHYRLGEGEFDQELAGLLGNHVAAYRTNILVANGDECPRLRQRLPFAFFKGRRNIGYWVWETESLPASYQDAKGLDEIWTPSAYSARAIEAAIDLPVKVVPHVLDLDQIDRVAADRARFGLPTDRLVCGFFFDCKSVLERKNPQAVVTAFRAAFGTPTRGGEAPRATLLLKVGSPEASPRAVSDLRRAADGLDVVWITEDLSRDDSLALMKSLDIYVSLHRSEGFGLTMAEAMAMGKAVVASGYSGNLEFMDLDNSRLVTTAVVVTDEAHGPYVAGTRWGDPSVDEAAACLAELADPGVREALGRRASQSVRARLAPAAVASAVKVLLQRPPAAPAGLRS